MTTYMFSSNMSYLTGHNGTPYELNLQQVRPIEYSDAQLLEHLASNGVVDMHQNPVSGEVRPVLHHEVAHISNGNGTGNDTGNDDGNENGNYNGNNNNGNIVGGQPAPEPQIPIITITAEDGPSASSIDTAKLSDDALRILRMCKYRRQLFATALQHFYLQFRIFNSSFTGDRFERYTKIVPTMYAARHAGNELVPPHKHFSDAVQRYRVFLAVELLGYLDPQGGVALEIEKKFNELSEEYGDKESKIRAAMGDMYHKKSGDGKKMIALYVYMFKQRGKLLQSQFIELKVLVERTLTEINKLT